jgi:ribosomal protein S17E
MPKKIIEKVSETIPDVLENLLGYFKSNFEENTQDILENANGTTGILIKLFAKPLIDGYFDKLSDKKLDNFGFETYIVASL